MRNDVGVQGSNVILFSRQGCPGNVDAQAANDDISNSDPAREPVKTITLRKKLDKSGCVIKVKVPVSEYIGVAVATIINDEGILTSTIELIHDDADFNYQVFEETGNDQVIAEWQNWGRQLRLPLFIRAGDGDLVPYNQQVDGVLLGQSTVRRKTANEANRRPRFLNRRK